MDGLLRGGLYPGTQLGENLGLAVDGREGLKLNTLCPCRGDDCAGVGISLLSCFSLGGEAWISARRKADSLTLYLAVKSKCPFGNNGEREKPYLCSSDQQGDVDLELKRWWQGTLCI